ncbi:MAG: HD domain-containing protein [Verrucomicrobia bacterium]|nr:MAG: HD domain-containing protein [Verrucomicrobiota bacterium]TAE87481.1 MAG: HD domain-containing protein [Verrucomicrobiota bacterium]TAF25763.1 MAG: HD domain-containing protein [Verrucomicrobiota bacterium]TAF41551.1 MAG: HD domain-containing protein [Verrucomicrobiota bacterium]
MNFLTVSALKEKAGDEPLQAAVDCELQSRSQRQTKGGKPYILLSLADATGHFTLNVWSDSPIFDAAKNLADTSVLRIDAEWTQTAYGLNASRIDLTRLDDDAREAFYAGDPDTAAKQRHDWDCITTHCAGLRDPRLHALANHFIAELGGKFRRAAAARKNHHARRGGLVEHVAQMMRSADLICQAYPHLNRDLIIAGILFHDCGKLWENQYGEKGFSQAYSLHGEMLGHIPLGIELVNKLWRDVADSPAAAKWLSLEPASEKVRLHLLHLIASHHGELQFGSPTLPRTPEAIALHYIDNLDAKLEMMKDAYHQAKQLADGIYEKQFPLPANLVDPLPSFELP